MTSASTTAGSRPAAIQRPPVRFCSACGSERIEFRIPEGDTLPRNVCGACGAIHYQNPKIVVGCLPELDGQVLLCLRAIEPRLGLWTLPAGFMELGETTAEGAVRETIEEAGARIELEGLFTVLNVVRVGQLHLFYRARLLDTVFDPGPETIEAQLFGESEVPWDRIAFRTSRETLQRFFADQRRGRFELHVGDIA